MDTRREELRNASIYLHLAAAEAGNSDKAIAIRIIQALVLVDNAMNPAKQAPNTAVEDRTEDRYQNELLRIETARSQEALGKCIDRSSQLRDQDILTHDQHANLVLFANLLRSMMGAKTYDAILGIEGAVTLAVSVSLLTQSQGDKVTHLGIVRRQAIDAKDGVPSVT